MLFSIIRNKMEIVKIPIIDFHYYNFLFFNLLNDIHIFIFTFYGTTELNRSKDEYNYVDYWFSQYKILTINISLLM